MNSFPVLLLLLKIQKLLFSRFILEKPENSRKKSFLEIPEKAELPKNKAVDQKQ